MQLPEVLLEFDVGFELVTADLADVGFLGLYYAPGLQYIEGFSLLPLTSNPGRDEAEGVAVGVGNHLNDESEGPADGPKPERGVVRGDVVGGLVVQVPEDCYVSAASAGVFSSGVRCEWTCVVGPY